MHGGSSFLSRFVGSGCAAIVAAVCVVVGSANAASPDEARAEIQRMATSTLDQLYAAQPSARQAIKKAAGYGVFSEISTKILLAGGGGGKGMVVDNNSGQETFMLMAMLQAGYGMGITKSHLVWVFEKESDLQDFVNNGLILGADVNLQVNPGVDGGMYQGAVQVQPGVWLYQLSDAGLALDLTVEGTKYFRDPDLN
jgi:lipid-binding SYLF domain-containing protein